MIGIPGETLRFDIIGSAASGAKAFRDTAESATAAAKGARMCADALGTQAKTASVASAATLALARSDKVLADAERELARDITVANAVLGKQNVALLGNGTAGAVGAMLSAAASGRAPSSGGSGGGVAPGIAMAAAAMGIAVKNTRLLNDAISQGLPVWTAGAGRFGFLQGHVQLFGGALTGLLPKFLSAQSGLELVIHGVIETAGTLIPATVAFAAFGAAAIPTVKDLASQMKTLNTVNNAFGQSLYPLTGGFEKVAQAVQPQVYTLFGEALYIAGRNTGSFQVLATGAGKVVDQLGARFANAVTQGNGFSKFAAGAAQDLSIWGNNIGNLGGIIGGLLKVLPGYAQTVGNVFGTVTHDIEGLVNSGIGQGILKIGLQAHGALIYVGLLATGFAKLAQVGLSGLATGLGSAAVSVSRLGAAGAAAGDGMLGLAAGAESAATLPWGWISIAAAGVGFLVYQLVNAKSAAQQFAGSIQSQILNVPLQNLSQVLGSDLAHATDNARTSLYGFLAAYGQVTAAQQAGHDASRQSVADMFDQAQAGANWAAVIQVVKSDQATLNANMGLAVAAFGSAGAAMQAFSAAGITGAQVLGASKTQMAELIIEAQAYDKALQVATQTGGQYAAALNALNYAAGNSRNALGQLNASMAQVVQDEDQLLSVLIGGNQAFTTFAQALQQMAVDAGAAAGSLSLNNYSLKITGQSAIIGAKSLDGLNAASLKLSGDYYGTVLPAAQKVIDALQMQQVAHSDLVKAVATEAAMLLPYAKGNDAARVSIVDLINNALTPGTVSLQDLNAWVGKNQTSMAGFKAIVDKAQVSASNLANVLGQDLNAMFQADLLKASGASGAVNALAKAIVTAGDNSQATRSARTALIGDLEKTGLSAQQATQYVSKLQQQIDALHGRNVTVGVFATGSGGVQVTDAMHQALVFRLSHLAAGGQVTGGTAGKDSVLAMLTPGEVVVPAGMVAGGAVDHLRGKLPGFAAGGLVDMPPWAAGALAGDVRGVAASDTKSVLQSQITQQLAAAAATAAATGVFTPGAPAVGNAATAQAFARSILPAGWSWPALDLLWNRESGWNAWAVNPTSGAYGIPQALPAAWGHPYALGDYANQIRWGIGYIGGRYGTSQNAWSHEVAAGWYGNGLDAVFRKPTVIGVGERGAERVQVTPLASRGGGGAAVVIENVTFNGPVGSAQELENWFVRIAEKTARQGRLAYVLRRSPSAA